MEPKKNVALSLLLTLCISPTAAAQKFHEANLGQYMDRLVRDDSQVLEAPALQQAVADLGATVVESSGNPNRFKFSFTVLNDPVPNAFSGPGGYVYITTGLLGLCSSRDEVVAVLAHEVAHVNQRHQTRFMRAPKSAFAVTLAFQFGSQMAASAVASRYASSYFVSYRTEQIAKLLGSAVAMFVNGMGVTAINAIYASYGAGDEFTADALALDYCRKAGFDAGRLADIISKVAGFSAPGLTALPGWHRELAADKYPKLEERIQRIKAESARASGVR